MNYQRVHFIGVGGIGMSALAKLLKLRGVHVSGSDIVESESVKEVKHLNIPVWIGSRPDRIGKDVEVVVYSSAVPDTDEELIRARHIGAREVVYNAFLGEVAKGFKTIAVTGTHGKSTTTALIGHVLASAGLDPTVVVGSRVSTFKHGNLRVGKSDLMVVEACEHKAHMLHLDPEVAVVTNVEFDHPDYYRDLAHVQEAMAAFVKKVPEGGTVVLNADDANSAQLAEATDATVVRVGEEGGLSSTGSAGDGVQVMHVLHKGEELGEASLALPGAYNVQNARVAIAVALSLGVDFEAIKKGIESFAGLWRRFERLGMYKGADLFTDYAHHPTAVRSLLEGARAFFPGRRLVLAFEPHQHARTRGLFDEFVASMDEADVVIVSEIYDVAGRNEIAKDTSSAQIVEAIKSADAAAGKERVVLFGENLDATRAYIDEVVQEGDVLLMVGAGDIDALAREMV